MCVTKRRLNEKVDVIHRESDTFPIGTNFPTGSSSENSRLMMPAGKVAEVATLHTPSTKVTV